MEQRTTQSVYVELNLIREALRKIQQDVDRLAVAVASDYARTPSSWLALAGVGSEVWRKVDVTAYINKERDAWN